jgi:hypothetical protein
MNVSFKFEALREPVQWTGRYNRIPGKEPVFKAKVDGTAHAYWKPWNSGEILTSGFVDGQGVRQMVKAVNRAKELHAGQAGGSFQINEFGQVICPIVSSSARYWVGTVAGVPTFHDPRDHSGNFELYLPPSTRPGTSWGRPYIGMKFNLDHNGSIYFQEEDGDTKRKIRLNRADPELVRRLQQVRGSGQTIRFIVNLHGVVVTKREPDWEPLFVGHIDLSRWFPKQP